MRRSRPACSSAAMPVVPEPALLVTSTRPRGALRIGASTRSCGTPAPPNPPMPTTAPSPMSASAASALSQSLLIACVRCQA
jgi:hypothetical protein